MNKHEMSGLRKIVTDHQREYLSSFGDDPVAAPPEGIMYALQADYRIFREVLNWNDVKIKDYIDGVRRDIVKGQEVLILK